MNERLGVAASVQKVSPAGYTAIAAALIAAQAFSEHLMGRVAICTCG